MALCSVELNIHIRLAGPMEKVLEHVRIVLTDEIPLEDHAYQQLAVSFSWELDLQERYIADCDGCIVDKTEHQDWALNTSTCAFCMHRRAGAVSHWFAGPAAV